MEFKEYIKKLHKWECYKRKIGNVIDDYDRVRHHYYGTSLFKRSLYNKANVACAIIYPILILFHKMNKNVYNAEKDLSGAIFVCPNDKYKFVLNDLPDALSKKYVDIKEISAKEYKNAPLKKIEIDEYGEKICVELFKRYPYAFFMNCSVFLHIYRIKRLIETYSPKAIISTQTDEDFTTSLITNYCERLGVKYIGIQHGAYCYDPNLAFFRFSEYYAWDEDTISNLKLVNDNLDFVKIFECKRFDNKYRKNANPDYHLTYYLAGDEKINELRRIRSVLRQFVERNYKVNLRNHPRAENAKVVKMLFKKEQIKIEDTRTVSIGRSITNTEYIVATRSTVLSEAMSNGLKAVIDDVAYDIEDLKYVRIKHLKNVNLYLSEIMKAELDK